MKKMKSGLLLGILAVMMGLVAADGGGTGGSGGVDLSGSVTGLSCTISIAPTTVGFAGVLSNGVAFPGDSAITVTNTGNINAALTMSASDWSIDATPYASSVGWTSYDALSGGVSYQTGSLSGTPFSIGALTPATPSVLPSDPIPATVNSVDVALSLTVPPYTPGGAYTQSLTIVSSG